MKDVFFSKKANRIWNRKTFYKMFKFGKLRIYVTYNMRLRRRNKRDDVFGATKQPYFRHLVWEREIGKCQRCGERVSYKEMELHHILPFTRFKEYCQDISNMQCLCHTCHKEIHCNPFLEAKLIRERCNELGLNIKDYYDDAT